MSVGVDLAAGAAEQTMQRYKNTYGPILRRGAIGTGMLVGGVAAGFVLTVGVAAVAGTGGVVMKFLKNFKETEIDGLKRQMDLANSKSADDPWATWTHPDGPDEELAERLQDELSEACIESQVKDGAILARVSDTSSGPGLKILSRAGMVMSIVDPEPERAADRLEGREEGKVFVESALLAEKLARAMRAKGYEATAATERTEAGKVVPSVSYLAAKDGTGEDMTQRTEIAELEADVKAHPERYAPAMLTKRSKLDLDAEVDLASVVALKESYVRAGVISPEAAERFERAASGVDDRPSERQLNYLAGLVSEGVIPAEAVDIARNDEVSAANVTAYINSISNETKGEHGYVIGDATDLGLFGKLASQPQAAQTEARDAYVGQNGQHHEATVTHGAPSADMPATDRRGDVPALADVDGDGLSDTAEDRNGDSVPDDREQPAHFASIEEIFDQTSSDAAAYNQMVREEGHGRFDRAVNDRPL